ncbi:MAG: succinyl-diaminopimelate desuccinylase [Rhodobiaceae bacterium]|nr:succinyl-diaminopimelate desuccinylase [Rhodobiaceae bacterium]MCC0054213.1 succinyl-diaminopimelate desuccinylase [Rhodobiaceae bacterium]
MTDKLDPVALAQALVRCPSVTPHEGGALEQIEGWLDDAGFQLHRVTFSGADTPDVENLYARIGSGAPALCFAGHTDVVPPGNEAAWTHRPFSGEIAGGELWGRGAADMKGGVAASIAAVLRHLEKSGPPHAGSISFLITGDEEGPSINGTAKLLKWAADRGEVFSHCVLGEPTNPEALGDSIKIGRRGSVSGEIHARGVQGHSAYPHLARNPVVALAQAVVAIAAEPLDTGTEHFQPSTLAFVNFDTGNPAVNVIPGEAVARFNIRFNDLHTPESLKGRIDALLAPIAQATGVALTSNFIARVSDVFVTQPGRLVEVLSAAIRAETGRTPQLSTSGGTSDARFIKDYCEVVEFGLVGKTMHQVDERVAVEDIETLTRIYERFIAGYFAALA